jgi:prophage regulatory protein
MSLNVTLAAPPPRPTRILRLHQVTEMIGLSRATIYRLMKMSRFPKIIMIGNKAVGWVEAEIEMWIAERQIFGMTVTTL